MRKLLTILAAACLSASASAQTGMTNITASHIEADMSGRLLTGKLCLTPVRGNNPTAFTANSGAQVLQAEVCFAVTAGVLNISVPDTTLAQPSGVGYKVVFKTSSGLPLYSYTQPIYPNGATWSLDSWTPTQSANVTVPTVNYSAAIPVGNCGTAPAIWYIGTAGNVQGIYTCIAQVWSELTVSGGSGNGLLHGTGAPNSGTGSNGDFYIDTAANVLYGPKASGAWPGSGTSLIGAAGANGSTIQHGSGAPSSGTGNNGDYYLDTVATALYGPKASGTWPGSGTSLIGPAGATGATGATGAAGTTGNTILHGTGAPASGTGNNGDFYIDTAANVLYGPKASGTWPGSGVSLTSATSGHAVSALMTCSDSSGSGTAQSCTTSPSFTPVANDCVIYSTTTANTGTALTLNVNSLGVKSIAKWMGSTTLVAGDVKASSPQILCYTGTVWNLTQLGNAPSGSFTDPGTTLGDVYYRGSSGMTRLAGPTSGTVPYGFCSTPSGGSATSPAWCLAGLAGRTVTTTSDTIAATDRGASVTYNSASAVAVTLTSAATLGNNFDFVTGNLGAGAVTFTPGAGTVNGGSTLVVAQNESCAINSQDNTNYVARCGYSTNSSYTLPTASTSTLGGVKVDGSTITIVSGVISAASGSNVITASGLTATDWYYMSSGGTLTLAEANSATTTPAICFAISTTQCQTAGVVTGLTGITAGGIYYLSDASAGGTLTSAPTTSGHLVQRVAIGLSTTSVLIKPSLDVGTIQ